MTRASYSPAIHLYGCHWQLWSHFLMSDTSFLHTPLNLFITQYNTFSAVIVLGGQYCFLDKSVLFSHLDRNTRWTQTHTHIHSTMRLPVSQVLTADIMYIWYVGSSPVFWCRFILAQQPNAGQDGLILRLLSHVMTGRLCEVFLILLCTVTHASFEAK